MNATAHDEGPRVAPVPKGSKVNRSRYSLKRATLEVEDQIRRRGRGSQKDVALGIGLTEQAFSAKLRMVHSTFSLEEFGAIADHWDAGPGWPFVAWDAAELLKNKRPHP